MLNEIDLSRTDLNLLVLFEVVMETRHVGRAAERLNLSPSAVSHGLGRLRVLLGDPLFLRTPRGVVPSARAEALAPAIADMLARSRAILASAAPFDPATTTRRFVIAAPDGISAVVAPLLLDHLGKVAPNASLALRQVLPAGRDPGSDAWRDTLAELDAGAVDIAILPQDRFPARFAARFVYRERFVVAARVGHPLLAAPDLDAYCAASHLVVSHGGDARGYVDMLLAERGLARRVALTVPNFFFALSALTHGDLVAALPQRFVAAHGGTFGVGWTEPPVPLGDFACHAVTLAPAMLDDGISWLIGLLQDLAGGLPPIGEGL